MNKETKLKFIKEGMTSIFNENGKMESCTILRLPKTHFLEVKQQTDNIVLFAETNKHKIKKPVRKQLEKKDINKKSTGIVFETKKLDNTQDITLNFFKNVKYVTVQGTTKGKGFQGVMKKYNFKGQRASHGNSLAHRTPGSTGSNQDPGKVMKGKKMPGHMGNVVRTQHNLKILDIDQDNQLLIIKGSVPGCNQSIVNVKVARRCKSC